jgi:hypothetical protein
MESGLRGAECLFPLLKVKKKRDSKNRPAGIHTKNIKEDLLK